MFGLNHPNPVSRCRTRYGERVLRSLLTLGALLFSGRLPCLKRALAFAECTTARQLELRPRPSSDVVADVPLLGWIVVEYTPHWLRGPPGRLAAVDRVDRARQTGSTSRLSGFWWFDAAVR